MKTLRWLWPLVIIASTCAINVMVFGEMSTSLRPPLAIWFISVCPGMALVRLLRLSDGWSEMALSVALSMALGVIVMTSLLYAGWWSYKIGLVILSLFSVVGAVIQLYAAFEGQLRSGMPTIGTAEISS
jgi:uncharacterized membrane protein